MRPFDPKGMTVYPRETTETRSKGVVLSYDSSMVFGYHIKWEDGETQHLKPGEFLFAPNVVQRRA